MIALKERIDFGQFRAAMATLANSRWKRKIATIWRFQNELSALQLEVSKCKVTTNYSSCFTVFWIFFIERLDHFKCLPCHFHHINTSYKVIKRKGHLYEEK